MLETWPGLAGCRNAALHKDGHSRHVVRADPGLDHARGASSGTFHLFPRGKGARLTVRSSLPAPFLNSSKTHICGYPTFYKLLCMVSRGLMVSACEDAEEAGNGDRTQ